MNAGAHASASLPPSRRPPASCGQRQRGEALAYQPAKAQGNAGIGSEHAASPLTAILLVRGKDIARKLEVADENVSGIVRHRFLIYKLLAQQRQRVGHGADRAEGSILFQCLAGRANSEGSFASGPRVVRGPAAPSPPSSCPSRAVEAFFPLATNRPVRADGYGARGLTT